MIISFLFDLNHLKLYWTYIVIKNLCQGFDIDLIAIIYIIDIGMQNNPKFRVNAVKDIIHREDAKSFAKWVITLSSQD
ncbi:hypothetical protein ES703_77668 [subsurface metagenome]